MALERDLHDLLYLHDCVIVPEWGGFLTHYRPARLDEARRVIQPPGKELSFNRHLVRNDGLLADRLAKREGIGFDAAVHRIDAEVAGWREALARQGRLELPHIGIFFRDAEDNLQFDPDKRSNYLRDAHGLRPLPAIPVERAAPRPVQPVLHPREQPPAVPEVLAARGWSWAAAASAALVIGAAAWWALQMDGSGSGQWSGFAPVTRSAPVYVPPSDDAGFAVEVPASFALPAGETGVANVPLAPKDSVRLVVDLSVDARRTAPADTTRVAVRPLAAGTGPLRYHVVGGCFAQPENADKMLADLLAKGFPARRLKQRGALFPVAYGSFANRAEAVALMGQVRQQQGPSAWLLVR